MPRSVGEPGDGSLKGGVAIEPIFLNGNQLMLVKENLQGFTAFVASAGTNFSDTPLMQ